MAPQTICETTRRPTVTFLPLPIALRRRRSLVPTVHTLQKLPACHPSTHLLSVFMAPCWDHPSRPGDATLAEMGLLQPRP